jgi:uncharacterized protein with predicted RNA binding PUA domain
MLSSAEFRRIAILFNYFFGKNVSNILPKEGYKFVLSPKSGRVKQVYHNGKLFATIRPNGSIALTPYSSQVLLRSKSFIKNCVYVSSDSVQFVSKGKSVFNKFVIKAGNNIRPKSEVVVLDQSGNPIALGTSVLSWKHMREFKRGIAVKVRKCIIDENR